MSTKYLLASDLDGTLIPPEKNADSLSAISEFSQWLKLTPELTLAYITGRHLKLALDGVRKYNLPSPAYFACDVGTSVYYKLQKKWVLDNEYKSKMIKAWGGYQRKDISKILKVIAEIRAQPMEQQAEFKVSYTVSPSHNLNTISDIVKKKLSNAGVKANIVSSVDPITKTGLIDVLPEGVGKDFVVHYLTKKLKIEKKHVIYAGDSGNDLLAFVSGVNAIVVGNALESVKKTLLKHMTDNKEIEKRIYFSKNCYARGVLEGCRHFGIEVTCKHMNL
jgi:sucrose-6F-phosphate phosphohydrolase